MFDTPELKTGPPAPVVPVEALLKEGVGQQRENGKGDNSMGDGDTVLVGDTLNRNTPSRAQPYPSRKGEN